MTVTKATLEDVLLPKSTIHESLIPSFSKDDIKTLAQPTGKIPTVFTVVDGVAMTLEDEPVPVAFLAKMANKLLREECPNNFGTELGKMQLLGQTDYYDEAKQRDGWKLPKKHDGWIHFINHGSKITDGVFIKDSNMKSLVGDQYKPYHNRSGHHSKFIISFIALLAQKMDRMSPKKKAEYLEWCRPMAWRTVGNNIADEEEIVSFSQITPEWEGESRSGPLIEGEQEVLDALTPLIINGDLPDDVAPGTPLTHLLSLLLHRDVKSVRKMFDEVANVSSKQAEKARGKSVDFNPLLKALTILAARDAFLSSRSRGKRTEETKQSVSYKAGRTKAEATKKANSKELVDAQIEAYAGAEKELFQAMEISVDNGKLTKDGVGGSPTEAKAMRIVLLLLQKGALPRSFDSLSGEVIVTQLFRTDHKRVNNLLTSGGAYGLALQHVHAHDPNVRMDDKLRELGQLLIELKAFRESPEYEEVEKDSKDRSDRRTDRASAGRQNKKSHSKSTSVDLLDIDESELDKKPSAKPSKSTSKTVTKPSKSTSKTRVTNSRGTTLPSVSFDDDLSSDGEEIPKPLGSNRANGIRKSGGRPSSRDEKARPSKLPPHPLAARARPNYSSIEDPHARELEANEADQREGNPFLLPLNFDVQINSSSTESTSEEEEYEEEDSSV